MAYQLVEYLKKLFMKKQFLIAAAGAAVVITYLFMRKRSARHNDYSSYQSNLRSQPKKHHLTQAFANAKRIAAS